MRWCHWQQLTMLVIHPVTPAQLLQLPPKLQQLHICCRRYGPEEVQQLAAWVLQNGRILSSLHLENCPRPEERVESADEWAAALRAVIAAFTATAAAAAAAAAVPDTTSAGWQLQSLDVAGLTSDCPSAALLRALPASSLTSLQCTVGWGDAADIAALCSLTGLQWLELQERDNTYNWDELDHSISGNADDVLAQLSVLQQLTRLQLSSARRVQLQQLRLPQLRRLVGVMDTTQNQEQLLLGHMSSLTALTLYDNRYPCDSFAPTEQVPPNLRTLDMMIWVERSSRERPYRVSLQPLLALSQLQPLHLDLTAAERSVPAAHELAQLSTLHSLQEVCIDWQSSLLDAAAVEDTAGALLVLPLTSMTWEHAGIPAAVMQQLGELQGLTALHLFHDCLSAYRSGLQNRVTPAALATVLGRLTALQRLHLSDTSLSAAAAGLAALPACAVHDDTDGVVRLVHTVGSLRQLSALNVHMHVRLQGEWQDMAAAHVQLLNVQLCSCTAVQQLNGKTWQWPAGARAEDFAVHVTHFRDEICTLQIYTVRN
jgi:hypothetical protein